MDEEIDDDYLTDHDLDVISILTNDDPRAVDNWVKSGGDILHPFEIQTSSLLHVASYKACNRIVRDFIAKGIDVNIRNEFGKTPLMSAAQFGHLETIKILAEAGADINASDARGSTALHWALTLADRLDIVQYLCDAGADPTARTIRGLTPNDYAGRLNRPLAGNFLSKL